MSKNQPKKGAILHKKILMNYAIFTRLTVFSISKKNIGKTLPGKYPLKDVHVHTTPEATPGKSQKGAKNAKWYAEFPVSLF